ncbi:hypothetical protein [Gillisia sp. Hel_I_29]|uniref:hypothetical protein n=1 Tax=Gillisia sp. Hel_I_29 TaxID=1249975 RepID=UPI0005515348|nr:hypothetical protein [Gillisia sp. Hel_I_29]
MSDSALTAIATILLVLVGLAQVFILISQKRQTRIALITEYRNLWNKSKKYWGNIVYIGRSSNEYYQVVNKKRLNELKEKTLEYNLSEPTIWARESVQKICGILSEISTRLLQGHLDIAETYPIFGTEFLRPSRPLRQLLEPEYKHIFSYETDPKQHDQIRKEVQDWLTYHDGIRRRCLILIDLLWAEACRLEDLPPLEMKSGADAKKITGKENRKRVFEEVFRLNGITHLFLAFKLSRYLRRSEYYSFWNETGIKKSRLEKNRKNWLARF